VYTLIFFSLRFLGAAEHSGPLAGRGPTSAEEKGSWALFILIIRGIPPFPGFIIKFNILAIMAVVGEGVLISAFVFTTAGFLYVYTTLLLWLRVRNKNAPGAA